MDLLMILFFLINKFAYDSQNNDFKILRMGAEVAEVYTLSTD